MYPIALIDYVAENPTAYRHFLRPWSTSAEVDRPEWWLVFKTQLWHWEHFRRWQSHTRSEGPPSCVEVDSSRWTYVDIAYNDFVRHFQRGSTSYSDAASSLLRQYRFTRPAQFHQDPAQQDKLTEWIEYLAFECAVHSRYTRSFQRLQLQHDEAWETAVNSGLLRPFETEEYICDVSSGHKYQAERDQIEQALSLAKRALEAAQRGPNSRREPASTRLLTVAAATARLDEAKEALQLFKRRKSLIIEFKQATGNFYDRKADIRRQDVLIQWILKEMPLVEAELRKSGVSKTDPDAVLDTHTTGHDKEKMAVPHKGARKRGRDETLNDELPYKRLRTGDQMDAGETPSSEVPGLRPQTRPRRRQHTGTSHLPPNANPPAPLRRSARIAARQQAPIQQGGWPYGRNNETKYKAQARPPSVMSCESSTR